MGDGGWVSGRPVLTPNRQPPSGATLDQPTVQSTFNNCTLWNEERGGHQQASDEQNCTRHLQALHPARPPPGT